MFLRCAVRRCLIRVAAGPVLIKIGVHLNSRLAFVRLEKANHVRQSIHPLAVTAALNGTESRSRNGVKRHKPMGRISALFDADPGESFALAAEYFSLSVGQLKAAWSPTAILVKSEKPFRIDGDPGVKLWCIIQANVAVDATKLNHRGLEVRVGTEPHHRAAGEVPDAA